MRLSSGDDRNLKNSAAASFEIVNDDMPLAALIMLGMRLEGTSGALDVSVGWSSGDDVTGVICGAATADVEESRLSCSGALRLFGKRSGY